MLSQGSELLTQSTRGGKNNNNKKTNDNQRGEGEIQDGGTDWKDEEVKVVLFTNRHASGLRAR